MSTPLIKGSVGGDLVVSKVDPIINLESRTYTNGTGDDVVLPPGMPFTYDDTDLTAVLTAAIGTVTAFNIQEQRIADGESEKIAVAVRGPLAFNEDALPADDIAGDPIVPATYAAALEALGFVAREEPVETEVQST